MYHIMTVGELSRKWEELDEGPWDEPGPAVDFAHAEVGVPWLVVGPDWELVAWGDSEGTRWSSVVRY